MKKVLLIDDDWKVRRIYSRFLVAEGFKVIEASTAMQGYEKIRKEQMDLVLMDIKMPEVDGGTLFQAMQLFHSKVKVIVTSVYPIDVQKKFIQGAIEYHDKASGLSALADKIKKVLYDTVEMEECV